MVKKYEKYKWKDLGVYRKHWYKSWYRYLDYQRNSKMQVACEYIANVYNWMKSYLNPIYNDYNDRKKSEKENGGFAWTDWGFIPINPKMSYGTKPYEFWEQLGKDIKKISWQNKKSKEEFVNKYFKILSPRGSWLDVL